ncbi:MAG: transporter substrate-binding domain-containing protein [Hyphomicrobiaceae bacterium]
MMIKNQSQIICFLAVLVLAGWAGLVNAAEPVAESAVEAPIGAPVDNQRRVVLRFVTEGDFPPFNYLDAEGALTGFNVDLARAICLEVNAACDIKVRPWDEQFGALSAGEADGAIAAQRVTWAGVAKVAFSDRYFHTPGHFAGKRDGAVVETTPEALEGKSVAVAKGTAHEAYLKKFFHESAIKTFDSIEIAREALADAKVAYVFDDAIGLSLWINGTNSRQCCELKGGPFLEPKFFGDGIAIALPKSDPHLKTLIDGALVKVRESGRFDELIQRYFPSRIY